MSKEIEEQAQVTTLDDSSHEKLVAYQDVDVALKFLREHETSGEIEDVDGKNVMRKVDWLVMPLLFGCYYLQYTDKTLLNYAAVMGIITDTNIPDNGFSHLAIAFYCSFLFFEPIQSYLLQRFPTAKYLGVNVMCWGLVLTMNCVVKDFGALVALRVLLGIFESACAPCLVVLTAMWYKRHEQSFRMGIWYQGTSVAPAISSLIAYGFVHYTASHPNASFKSWQILYLLFGLITICWGILVFIFLPDNPTRSRFSDAEKVYIIERVRGNETGIENKKLKWKQVKEVMVDVKTWLLALIVITTNVPNGAVSSFQSIIIENFGYDVYATLLLNLPGAAIAFVGVYLSTWFGGRYNIRGPMIIALIVPTLLGGALMAWLPADNKSGLLAGNFLTNTVGCSLPLMYSWITSNFAGHTKKITMNALVLMSFCIGNIIGPETFQAGDAPQYIPAKITIVVILAFAIIFTVLLDGLYWLENRRRDRADEHGQGLPRDYEFLDLTDKENRGFRYLL